MRRALCLSLCLLSCCATVQAQESTAAGVASQPAETWLDRIEIHGFAAQAAIRTSDNRFFGDSPETSFDATEIGLNASARVSTRLLFAGQVLLRRAGDMDDGSPSLDYLLANINLASSAERIAGVRAGRVKTRIGLYNETRDVPFTHPGIFLPQTVYFDKTRNLLLSSDGVQVYGDWFTAAGSISAVAGVGRPVIDENVEWAFLGADFDGDLDAAGPMLTGSVWYQDPSERIKLGVSSLLTSLEFDAGPAAPIGAGDIDLAYNILSAQYNAPDWTLTSELMLMPLHKRGFGVPLLDIDNTVAGWYLQGTYRIKPRLTLLARYERGVADLNDPDGSDQSQLTGGMTPAFDFRSEIWTAGLRWDVTPWLMLRTEYQHHNGSFELSIRENPDPSQLRGHWDLFAVQAAVRF